MQTVGGDSRVIAQIWKRECSHTQEEPILQLQATIPGGDNA